MAKKKAAASPDFNLSALVREALTKDPKSTPASVQEFILAQHPDAKINKGSFQVAFYTMRRKLAGGGTVRGGKMGIRKTKKAGGHSENGGLVDMNALQAAAKLIRDAGGADAAIEAIKAVQAVQIQ